MGQRADPGMGGETVRQPEYYAAATEPKAIRKVPAAEHTGGLDARPAEYERRVTGVLRPHSSEARDAAGPVWLRGGTAAAAGPAPWVDAFGERVVIALDVRDGRVRTAGWTADGGLTVDEATARFVACGATRVLCTAIDRDGTLAGPDL